DRLAFMIGSVVPDPQVEQVDGKQRILRRPCGSRGNRLVHDIEVGHAPDGTRKGLVLVGPQLDGLRKGRDNGQEHGHVPLHCTRIRSAMRRLKRRTALLLGGCHAPAPTMLRNGKPMEEVRPLPDRHVVARRMVLAVLEAHEAVERERLAQEPLGPAQLMEQQAMPPQPPADPPDRLGRNLELTGNLTKSRAPEEPMKDGLEQLSAMHPVRGQERLIGEPSTAGVATVTLDTVRRRLPEVETIPDETP